MNAYLFVYGTLLRRSPHPMARYLENHGRFMGNAHIQGRLYDLGPYPGLRLSDAPTDRVHGELFELRDAPRTIASLDEYEGLGESDPEEYPFQRRLALITCGNNTVEGWVYFYIPPIPEHQHIASGRYKFAPPEETELPG